MVYSQDAVIKSLSVLSKKQTAGGLNRDPLQNSLCLVDATAGNGYDSLFMANALNKLNYDKSVLVHAFDVQEQALKNTEQRLKDAACLERVCLHLKSHSLILEALSAKFLSQDQKQFESFIGVAMFNLGFLPRSDKCIITKEETTLSALKQLCFGFNLNLEANKTEKNIPLIVCNGLISIHCYAGHEGGELETEAVLKYVKSLDSRIWKVFLYEELNKYRNRELLILIERLI